MQIDLKAIIELRIILFFEEQFALIKFDSFNDCQNAFHQLSFRDHKVSYCYDGTDLLNSHWYPVIVRDIPCNLSIDEIKLNYFVNFENEITRAIGPALVGGINSCIFVTQSLEISEEICYFIKHTYPEIKAHLHYKICKVRDNKDKSHFANYFESKNSNQSMSKYLSPQLFNHKKKQITIIDVLNNQEKKRKKGSEKKEHLTKEKKETSESKLTQLLGDMNQNRSKEVEH